MQYNMGTSRSLCPINAKDEMRFSSLALSDQKRHREREREIKTKLPKLHKKKTSMPIILPLQQEDNSIESDYSSVTLITPLSLSLSLPPSVK